MTASPFGNLSFSSYTMETQAERCVLAIQAALRVAGYAPTHIAMKKVLRLKRSMSRSKTRRYSFNLVQSAPKDVEQKDSKVEVPVEEPRANLLVPVLERITGLSFRSKDIKVTSSGHFLVKFVLIGKQNQCRIEPGTNSSISASKAREEVASFVLRSLSHEFPSFSIQPFRVKMDKGIIGVSVQCIYRDRADVK